MSRIDRKRKLHLNPSSRHRPELRTKSAVLIYGDEPLGTPSGKGGLTPRPQDTPHLLSTNKAGQTLPGYILRALGEGLAAIPERITRSSGELQRQGDVYDPAPAADVMEMLYGARALGGAMRTRPIPTRPTSEPRGTPPVSTVPEPPPFRPPVTPEGQYQFPVDAQHQTRMPLRGGQAETPPRQLPLELEGGQSGGTRQGELFADDAVQQRQGQTPGSDASAGVAQEPRPPAAEPVGDPQNRTTLGDGAKETGGENLNTRDYGKKAPGATGEASGVNVLKDGVDPTLAHTINPDVTPASVTPEAPPVRPATAEPGLLPEKQPFYEAAKAAAPNLPPEQLLHIANLAGGPKGAALMARNAARRMAEESGAVAPPAAREAPAPREAPIERAPVPEGTMELPTVEVKPGTAPTPEAVAQAAEATAQTATKAPETGTVLNWQAQETGAGGGKKTTPLVATAENGDIYRVQPARGLKGWEVTRNGHVVERGRSRIDAVRGAERISQRSDLPDLPATRGKIETPAETAARDATQRKFEEDTLRQEAAARTAPAAEPAPPIPGSKAAQRAEAAQAVAEFEARKAAAAQPEKPLYPHASLSKPKLEAAYKKAKEADSKTTRELIEAGRGNERPSETAKKTDELSQRAIAAAEQRQSLFQEMERRKAWGGTLKPIPEANRQSFFKDERGGGRLPTNESIVAAARAVGKSVAEFLKDERGGLFTRKPQRTPAEEKVLSRLAEEPGLLDNLPQSKEEISSGWRNFYAGFKNELDAIEQLKHRSLTDVAPEVDPGVLARLTRGLGGRVNQIINDGIYDVKTRQVVGDPLKVVMDKIKVDEPGFQAYAISRATLERAQHGAKTGVDLQAARQVVAQSGAKWGPVLDELNVWKNHMLDNAVDILGPKAVADIKKKYPGHIALHRLLDPAGETGQALGGGLQARNPLHRLEKGSEAPILNTLDSTIKDNVALLDMSERNRVGIAMRKLNDTLGPNAQFMRKVVDTHPIHVTAGEINKHLGIEGITEQVADGLKVFRKDAFTPRADRIRVFENGVATVYEVPEGLGKAYHALDQQSLHLAVRIIGAPARWLRTGAVLTPEFVAKNPLRDQLAAFTQTKYGYVPVYDFLVHGLPNLFPRGGRHTELFQRMAIEGMFNANLVSLDRKLVYTDPRTILQHTANVVTKPYQLLQMTSEIMENATRLGVARRAMEAPIFNRKAGGAHPIEAAWEGREGTVDFQRVGGSAIQKILNHIIPFYNVALEGTDRTFRAFRDRKIQTALTTVAGITLPSVALWYYNKNDERIQQLAQWRKDVAWNFAGSDRWKPISTQGRNEILDGMVQRLPGIDTSKLPNTFRQTKDGSWEYNDAIIWALPKPPGVGQLFGSIPERMLDYFVSKHPDAFKELGKGIMQAFAPGIIPQAALPEVERWANKSVFMERTLISPTLQKLPPSQHITPQTSDTAQAVGKVVRSVIGDKSTLGSPVIIDNYIRQWAGGLGKHVTDMLDYGIFRAKDAPVRPSWSAADVPLLKGFVARFPSSDAEAIRQFYDTYEERKIAAAGIKNLQKKGLPEDPTLLRENPVQGIHNALGVGFKTVRNIMDSKTMSADDKRAAIDLTYLFMIEKAKQGNKALENSKRKATPPPNFIPYRPEAQ